MDVIRREQAAKTLSCAALANAWLAMAAPARLSVFRKHSGINEKPRPMAWARFRRGCAT